jgi:hypothetical protein
VNSGAPKLIFEDDKYYSLYFFYSVAESKHRRGKISDPSHRLHDSGASSRGIIPQAKIRTIKMTFVIIFGKI